LRKKEFRAEERRGEARKDTFERPKSLILML
jgi:hypothetical protein